MDEKSRGERSVVEKSGAEMSFNRNLGLWTKGGFKSEEAGGFLLLRNKYFKSLSRAENLNFTPKTVNKLHI